MYMYRVTLDLKDAAGSISGTISMDDGGLNRPQIEGSVTGKSQGDQVSLKAVFSTVSYGMAAQCSAVLTGFNEVRNDSLQLKVEYGQDCGNGGWKGRKWPAVFLTR
ncbi:hypothetical protein GCM10008961_31560 [Deinococcus knuensis]|uniref:Uncharacterized protein n=2 Tax=Deinococcus knuensis TaxID=1837380 RepID=A0ABQ2STK5_9DEIO|nr:hypothetical protein GCM10008961_31560 [Deinococcus knuensis]